MSCRKSVKLLNRGGNMLQLCNELRSPFVTWISSQQVLAPEDLDNEILELFCNSFKYVNYTLSKLSIFILYLTLGKKQFVFRIFRISF